MRLSRVVVLALSAVSVMISSALAADLGTAYRPASKPVAVATWNGCYIGGNVGYGWAPTDWSDHGDRFTSHSANGAVGGGQIGCDYQTGPWVFGIQGMLDASGMKGSSLNLPLDPGGAVVDDTKISWLAMLTGRIGYTIQPETLLYLKGGAAWVRERHTECCEPTRVVLDQVGVLDDGTAKVTRSGWTAGVGLERMFAPNWTAFIEYDFIGLGDRAVTFSPINGAPGPFRYNINQDVHLLLIGLNYRFGAY
jgi:outer membrane immunogenic protein